MWTWDRRAGTEAYWGRYSLARGVCWVCRGAFFRVSCGGSSQGWGMKSPPTACLPVTRHAKIRNCPRRNARTGDAVSCASCAFSPTESVSNVALASASQTRSTRAGCVIRVSCHCQPPLLRGVKIEFVQSLAQGVEGLVKHFAPKGGELTCGSGANQDHVITPQQQNVHLRFGKMGERFQSGFCPQV